MNAPLLHHACEANNPDAVGKLIKNSPRLLTETDKHGHTALHMVARLGRKSQLLELLLQHMSVEEINTLDTQQNTALDLALREGNVERTAPLLIQYGAELTEERIQLAVKTLARTHLVTALVAGGFGESACPIESVTDLTLLVVDKLKAAGFFESAVFGIITLVSGGIAIVGASLFFIATAYREKHLNYGDAAQKNLELRLRLEALKRKSAILKEYEEIESSIKERMKKLEKWNNNLAAKQLSANIENKVKNHADEIEKLHQKLVLLEKKLKSLVTTEIPPALTIPKKWEDLSPTEDTSAAELYAYATKKDIVTAIGIGLGKGFGYFSATAGTFAGGVLLFGLSAVGGPVGLSIAITFFILIGVTVGYLAYQTTRQEFGKKNLANHRLMLELNKEIGFFSEKKSILSKQSDPLYEQIESLCEKTITAVKESEKQSNQASFFKPAKEKLKKENNQLKNRSIHITH